MKGYQAYALSLYVILLVPLASFKRQISCSKEQTNPILQEAILLLTKMNVNNLIQSMWQDLQFQIRAFLQHVRVLCEYSLRCHMERNTV